jgi:hypothetical protein
MPMIPDYLLETSNDELSCRAEQYQPIASFKEDKLIELAPYAVSSSAMLDSVDSTSKCNTVAKE